MNLFQRTREALFSAWNESPLDGRLPGVGEKVTNLLDTNQAVSPKMLEDANKVYDQLIIEELTRLAASITLVIENAPSLGIDISGEGYKIGKSLSSTLRNRINYYSTFVLRRSNRIHKPAQPELEVLIFQTNEKRLRLEKLRGMPNIDNVMFKDISKMQQLILDIG